MIDGQNKPSERRLSRSAQVCKALREQIVNRTRCPGDPLNKLEIAATPGVSRFPVSNMPDRFTIEGLVEIVPRHGSFVVHPGLQLFDEVFPLHMTAIRANRNIKAVRRPGDVTSFKQGDAFMPVARTHPERVRRMLLPESSRRANAIKEHSAIREALAKGNPKAARSDGGSHRGGAEGLSPNGGL